MSTEQLTRALREHPMVAAWIAEYRRINGSDYKNCTRCGFPHAPNLLCGSGATFGALWVGGEPYWVDASNVKYFIHFRESTQAIGFHWRDDIGFGRMGDGAVQVTFYEKYNNTPQKKTWKIPGLEWESIVKSLAQHEAQQAPTPPVQTNKE